MRKWYEETAENGDVVISSRVRLARNLKSYVFGSRLRDADAVRLVKEVQDVAPLVKEKDGKRYFLCNVNRLSETDREAMVERYVVSPTLAAKKQETGLILSEDESVSIMINEEDHIRIQAVAAGMDLEKVFAEANFIDDILNEELPFSFDDKLGYLTACPTNVGTGLRASYMMFLPALMMTGRIQKLSEEMGKFGVTIRGIYGEGTKSQGCMYQVSNQKTLGRTEKEIIANLDCIVDQIIKQERDRRGYILREANEKTQDKVCRSYGILRYAKQLGTEDAMALLAQIKFGMDTGLIHLKGELNPHNLMMDIQPASLQKLIGKNVGSLVRDRARAEYIQKKLPDIE
ncbi:MAG: protein arginine kinase [Lachnospiraceae bacterium]|nr:protein arginine kinase [Lachnospiraceae bacterium]